MSENETPQAHTMKDRVLGAIQQGGVAPKPRWHFLLREGVVWLVAVCALALGSLATALTLYIGNASFFMERHIFSSDLATLSALVPLVWLVLLVVGVFYSIHAIHSTRRGYRWHTSWLVGAALALSVILGWGLYASGASEAMDRYLLSEVPMYHPLSGFRPEVWIDTKTGVIAGFVEEVSFDGFTIRVLDGALVRVATTSETRIPPFFEVCEGVPVRVSGREPYIAGETVQVEAVEIKPFHGRGGHRPRGVPPHYAPHASSEPTDDSSAVAPLPLVR